MISACVLLVSDDFETGRVWVAALANRGVNTSLVHSAAEALAWWSDQSGDLIVIDVHTAELDYLDLIRQLRDEVINPIILLLPGYDEDRFLAAYDAGVDECVGKPVSPRLFLAKVKSWLSRAWSIPAEMLDSFQAGDLRLEPGQRQLFTADGAVVKLSNLEFRLLHLFMAHPGQVLEPGIICDRVWGYTGGGDSSLVKNLVYRLRRKIEPDPALPTYIQSGAGGGYVFYPD